MQTTREARATSGDKPRLHLHYLKGSLACGQCGEPLAFERVRNRLGNYYEYYFCIGQQNYKNGCTFRRVPVSLAEQLIEDHWATITLPRRALEAIRDLVVAHIEVLKPTRSKEREQATLRLGELDRQSSKLMQAHYEDALALVDLKREQARIAMERARCEQIVSQQDVSTERMHKNVSDILRLLADAHGHYLASEDLGRRDMNQAVFERVFLDDDDVVGGDLTEPFQRLLSESLPQDLETERKRHLNRLSRTSDHLYVPEVRESPHRGQLAPGGDLPPRSVRKAPTVQISRSAALERPRGRLPWETKNPAPQVAQVSTETILVGAEGIEPPTTSL